jgi:EmrB/QacA subfamily drug resistance transporter
VSTEETVITEPGEPPPLLTQRQIYLVFGGLMTGLLLSSLDTTIVATALPTIAGDLGNLEHIPWIATAYLLSSTAATPMFGKLSDLYGRRLLFQIAIVIFLAGSLFAGLSQTFVQLVIARGVQGVGAGGLMATAFVIIGDIVSPRERGRYIGLLTSVFAFSAVAGPLVGGFIVDHWSWRWIFTINLPLGLVALVVTSYALRVPFNRRERRIDWLGSFLLIAGVTFIVLVTTMGGKEYSWTSPMIMALTTLAIASTIAFCWWESRASEPILPMRLFRNPIFAVSMLLLFCVGSALYMSDSFLPLFLQTVTGTSATKAGLLLLPLMIGVTVSSIVAGRLTTRTGRYRIWPLVGLGMATAGVTLLSRLTADTPAFYVSCSMLVLGLGIGMTIPTITLAVQNAVDWTDLGVASSAVTFIRSLGGAIGLAAYGAVFSNRVQTLPADVAAVVESPEEIRRLAEPLHSQVVDTLAYAIRGVFLFAIPVVAIAWVASFFLKEIPLRSSSPLELSKVDGAADDEGASIEAASAIV